MAGKTPPYVSPKYTPKYSARFVECGENRPQHPLDAIPPICDHAHNDTSNKENDDGTW